VLLTLTLRSEVADGETQTRTGDTAVFSHVLYQLSYLAGRPDASVLSVPLASGRRRRSAQPKPELGS
jgi:hypothetical protein